jgi:hypothetical protein
VAKQRARIRGLLGHRFSSTTSGYVHLDRSLLLVADAQGGNNLRGQVATAHMADEAPRKVLAISTFINGLSVSAAA